MNKDKFKVLLIHANSTLDTLIPPNLAVISSTLKNAGHEVKLFDTTFYKTRESTGDDARVRTLQVKETNFDDLGIYLKKTDMYDDFLKTVEDYKPNLIGLSAVSLTYPFGIEFLRKLKKNNLESKISTIVGGIHATISPEEVLDENSVDYVCIGEGEYALKELCDALKNKKTTSNIKNIWAKKDNKIYKNELRPPVNLDEIPFQDWEIFDENRIFKPMAGKIRRIGCFELDRGCPYSCTYCCNDFWNKIYDNKNYRKKSIDKFIEEVKTMKEKYNLEYIYLASESFLSSPRNRFMKFAEMWKKEINLPFWGETRPETIDEERIQILENIGMNSISIGVESGSPEIRKMLRRYVSNEKITKAFEILGKTKIRVCANSIIGFPTETREQVFETIEINRKINESIPNLSAMIHVFNPYRGTPLYDFCVEKGYISKQEIGGDYRQDFVLQMPQISKEQILGLQRTFALYSKFPKSMWPEIRIAEQFNEQGNKKFEELSKIYKNKYMQ